MAIGSIEQGINQGERGIMNNERLSSGYSLPRFKGAAPTPIINAGAQTFPGQFSDAHGTTNAAIWATNPANAGKPSPYGTQTMTGGQTMPNDPALVRIQAQGKNALDLANANNKSRESIAAAKPAPAAKAAPAPKVDPVAMKSWEQKFGILAKNRDLAQQQLVDATAADQKAHTTETQKGYQDAQAAFDAANAKIDEHHKNHPTAASLPPPAATTQPATQPGAETQPAATQLAPQAAAVPSISDLAHTQNVAHDHGNRQLTKEEVDQVRAHFGGDEVQTRQWLSQHGEELVPSGGASSSERNATTGPDSQTGITLTPHVMTPEEIRSRAANNAKGGNPFTEENMARGQAFAAAHNFSAAPEADLARAGDPNAYMQGPNGLSFVRGSNPSAETRAVGMGQALKGTPNDPANQPIRQAEAQRVAGDTAIAKQQADAAEQLRLLRTGDATYRAQQFLAQNPGEQGLAKAIGTATAPYDPAHPNTTGANSPPPSSPTFGGVPQSGPGRYGVMNVAAQAVSPPPPDANGNHPMFPGVKFNPVPRNGPNGFGYYP